MRTSRLAVAALAVSLAACSVQPTEPLASPSAAARSPNAETPLVNASIDPSVSIVFTLGSFADGRIMVASGGEIRALTTGSPAAYVPIPSRDGNQIAFATPSGVSVMQRDGTEMAVVDGTVGCLPGDWFPDNGRFLVNCDGDIGIATRAGLATSAFAIGPPGAPPTLSPDGTTLAVGGSGADPRTSIALVDLAGQTVGEVGGVGGPVFGFPRWSPDGRSLVYAISGDQTEVRTIAVDGDEPVVVATTPALDVWATWSADGTRIVYGGTSDQTAAIFAVNADRGDPKAVLDGYPLGDVYWLP